MKNIYQKASRKVKHLLARPVPYTDATKRRTLMNSFLNHSLIIAS